MNNKSVFVAAAGITLAVASFAPRAASAAGSDELWEVTSKMQMPNMPDMPDMSQMPPGMGDMMGGMGARTQQICRGDDPREDITKNKEMKDCTISDFNRSGLRVTMKATCKNGSMEMDTKYNAARTAYTGTMRMKSSEGDMVMTLNGRKIGSCDAGQARAAQNAKIAKMQARVAEAQAQGRDAVRKADDEEIASCAKAVELMDTDALGMFGQCHNKSDSTCRTFLQIYEQRPKVARACQAKAAEWCDRFQSRDGFFLAHRRFSVDKGERMCGVKASRIKAPLCEEALRSKDYEFLGVLCPAQARPLWKSHCAGRSFTVKKTDPRSVEQKWYNFCVAAMQSGLAGNDDAEGEGGGATSSGPAAARRIEAPAPVRRAAARASEEAEKTVTDEAVGAGVKTLRGLFGH